MLRFPFRLARRLSALICFGVSLVSLPSVFSVEETIGTKQDSSSETPSRFQIKTDWNVPYGSHDTAPSEFHVGNLYLPHLKERDSTQKWPVVLMIHGGAWVAGDKFHTATHAKNLTARGFVVFSIDYRLAPEHSYPAQLDDCKLAFRWLVSNAERYCIDVQRMAVWGYSAGGQLAAIMTIHQKEHAASSDNAPGAIVACVCGGTPFNLVEIASRSDALDRIFVPKNSREPDAQTRLNYFREASPTARSLENLPPFFLWHGDKDLIVPIFHSEQMHRLLQNSDVESEFYVVKNKGHLTSFIDPSAVAKSYDFLTRVMQSDSTWLDSSDRGQ